MLLRVKQNTSVVEIWFVARVIICPGFPESIEVYLIVPG